MVSVLNHGRKYNDDEWCKSKLLLSIIPYVKMMVMMIHSIMDYLSLTPSDVSENFVTKRCRT
jgi:hypothetical protein